MSADNSNNPRYKLLSPEDVMFYETVNSRITGSHALPYEIPVDSFFTITIACLKWFWNWYESATQEKMLFVPYNEISNRRDGSGNIDLLLPNGIEAVIDWKQSSSSISQRINDYLRISLLQTYSSGYSSGAGDGSFRSGYAMQAPSVANAVVAMYEATQFKETFTRGIRANYNKNTQIFRIMTNIDTGLVMQCMVRLLPRELYGDIMFENYVVACIEEQLGRILSAFEFKLPGSVTINYDQIKEYGQTSRKEIESDIKASNNTDFMFTK